MILTLILTLKANKVFTVVIACEKSYITSIMLKFGAVSLVLAEALKGALANPNNYHKGGARSDCGMSKQKMQFNYDFDSCIPILAANQARGPCSVIKDEDPLVFPYAEGAWSVRDICKAFNKNQRGKKWDKQKFDKCAKIVYNPTTGPQNACAQIQKSPDGEFVTSEGVPGSLERELNGPLTVAIAKTMCKVIAQTKEEPPSEAEVEKVVGFATFVLTEQCKGNNLAVQFKDIWWDLAWFSRAVGLPNFECPTVAKTTMRIGGSGDNHNPED